MEDYFKGLTEDDEAVKSLGRAIIEDVKAHLITKTEPSAQSPAAMACYKDLARKIVDEIIDDLKGRKGLRHEYHLCDEDIREEIKNSWEKIIEDKLGKSL